MKLYHGNAVSLIDKIKDNSIQSIITSPPYFCLRDYEYPQQIGLEDQVEDYLTKLIQIWNTAKNKLKDDGLLFINIDDTYYYPRPGETKIWGMNANGDKRPGIKKHNEYRKSSLMAVPQKLIIKMIESGWIFRQQIIWQKPNCMPESTTSRFTRDYEAIFMFSKSENYKFNQLKEDMKTEDLSNPRGSNGTTKQSGRRNEENKKTEYTRNMRSVWSINNVCSSNNNHYATFPAELARRLILCSTDEKDTVLDPFSGSGTTLKVAKQLNRHGIGIEINSKYVELAEKNINDLFTKVEIIKEECI
ncbi:Modification methylase MboII [Sebaldella termitidis]|uniref:Methyltransferase n=1 Tax=Sebaldella termitidis (strain ATCC 33386 / NCTC 11300) TaxID=526218 RepID=D1AR17_SEBTE|nr:site-specific DNA-methyltransferase [Sebaldella termitidis]ACZ07705.1 DNA methylase N-4/N-6 domain protein [Sebaldella termitidis ATCC 33386]SUI23002.1 Modification methylase MboII [Sebaldella termitidis]